MYGPNQNREANRYQQSAGQEGYNGVEILLIGRNPATPMYTDEVLRRAGFRVHAITPGQISEMARPDAPTYPLVVFSNTLYPRDISEIGPQLRSRNPASKLLLMLGPDSAPENLPIFDAMMEGLDGPAALIREVRRLAGLPPMGPPPGDDFARSA